MLFRKTETVSFENIEKTLLEFKSYVYNRLTDSDSNSGSGSDAVVHLSNLAFGIQRTSKLLQKQLSLIINEENEIQ